MIVPINYYKIDNKSYIFCIDTRDVASDSFGQNATAASTFGRQGEDLGEDLGPRQDYDAATIFMCLLVVVDIIICITRSTVVRAFSCRLTAGSYTATYIWYKA